MITFVLTDDDGTEILVEMFFYFIRVLHSWTLNTCTNIHQRLLEDEVSLSDLI